MGWRGNGSVEGSVRIRSRALASEIMITNHHLSDRELKEAMTTMMVEVVTATRLPWMGVQVGEL